LVSATGLFLVVDFIFDKLTFLEFLETPPFD